MEKITDKNSQAVESEKAIFSDALKSTVKDFSQRSQEIIFSRWGVFSSHSLTLEEIGKKYQITRERVRQVIREVLKKVKEKKDQAVFREIEEKIILALRNNGGIMEEQKLLSVLVGKQKSEQAAVSFFLECFDSICKNQIKGELKIAYSLPSFEIEKWRNVKNDLILVLKQQAKPLSVEKLFELTKAKSGEFDLSIETFTQYLEISEEIKQNTFGKWGIAKWKEISPKGTREKAYLVLKEVAKPLHFRDIAKKIDQYHLNKKKTHAQTVHNELIKDKNFVLVGRGIYALVEWGYRSGTVKDVIEEILKKNKAPLSKEEVLEMVLKIRRVKKSTIVINLNNYFAKSKTGTYSIKKS